jgi:hypothetical protein
VGLFRACVRLPLRHAHMLRSATDTFAPRATCIDAAAARKSGAGLVYPARLCGRLNAEEPTDGIRMILEVAQEGLRRSGVRMLTTLAAGPQEALKRARRFAEKVTKRRDQSMKAES